MSYWVRRWRPPRQLRPMRQNYEEVNTPEQEGARIPLKKEGCYAQIAMIVADDFMSMSTIVKDFISITAIGAAMLSMSSS